MDDEFYVERMNVVRKQAEDLRVNVLNPRNVESMSASQRSVVAREARYVAACAEAYAKSLELVNELER